MCVTSGSSVDTPVRVFNGLDIAATLALAAFAACAAPAVGTRVAEPDRERGRGESIDNYAGLSGLTWGPDGELWAVSERNSVLVSMDPSSASRGEAAWIVPDDNATASLGSSQPSPTRLLRVVQLEGIEARREPESIAFHGGRFYLGTESDAEGRGSDLIYVVELAAESAVVVDSLVVNYAEIPLRAAKNRGIEGLCATESSLLAAVETVLEKDQKRLAPVGRYHFVSKVWTWFFVELGSATGKISAIECTEAQGSIEFWAVERHYGVARLLAATVPEGEGMAVTPSLSINLAPSFERLPNLEGMSIDSRGGLFLLNDNQMQTVFGASQLFTGVIVGDRFDWEDKNYEP